MDPQQENQNTLLKRLRDTAIAGGVAGAGVGGLSSLLAGATPGGIGKMALKGAVAGGIGAPAAIESGRVLIGPPSVDEKNPHTRRGLVGGALLGGAAGLAGTALLHKKIPLAKLGSFGDKAEDALKSDNAIFNAIRRMTSSDSKLKAAGAYGLGGGSGALGGALFGADEGMGQDVLANELDSARKRKMRQTLQESEGV